MKVTDELLKEHAPRAAAQLMERFPPEDELPEPDFTEGFQEQVQKIKPQKRTRRGGKWLKTAVAAVLVCAVLGRNLVVSVGAYVYEQVYQFVSIHISAQKDSEPVPIEFGYLPDGFELTSQEQMGENGDMMDFQGEDGAWFHVSRWVVSGAGEHSREIVTDGQVETVTVDEREYWVVTEVNESSVYWVQENEEFLITGNLPPEELLEIGVHIGFE